MSGKAELESAFNAAIAQIRSTIEAGMQTATGGDARSNLEHLSQELVHQRERSVATGSVDREWLQKTIRWVADWAPATDLTLMAALGRIARIPHLGKP